LPVNLQVFVGKRIGNGGRLGGLFGRNRHVQQIASVPLPNAN